MRLFMFFKGKYQGYNKLIGFCITVLCTVIFALALCSYSRYDSTFFFYSFPEPKEIHNFLGGFGANLAGICFYLLGGAAYILILFWLLFGLNFLKQNCWFQEWDRFCALLVSIIYASVLMALYGVDCANSGVAGGLVGQAIARLFVQKSFSFLVYSFLYCVALVCLLLITRGTGALFVARIIYTYGGLKELLSQLIFLKYLGKKYTQWFVRYSVAVFSSAISLKATIRFTGRKLDRSLWDLEELKLVVEPILHQEMLDILELLKTGTFEKVTAVTDINKPVLFESAEKEYSDTYQIPDTTLLVKPSMQTSNNAIDRELKERALLLEQKLERFGVYGKVSTITQGPVVTLFEYEPTIDSKLSKIVALEDDLALALQAVSLRIIAPIPGRSVVGFEVANTQRKTVLLSAGIAALKEIKQPLQLPLVLGVDTVGKYLFIDLASLPHLLVAGSTGSGKSVGLHSMLMSLFYSLSPSQMRLILIDPKRLEFAAYTDIPQLLFPVITEPTGAVAALRWAVQIMEERYKLMASAGVQNIFEYHKKNPERQAEFPFIVIVIDELADLMILVKKEIESVLARLAQMARAAGIHLIVATQRPSVDVITGVIKANFPSRIAFKVLAKVDSRTILDASGADKLLGKGDMLWLDTQGRITRVHGAYVSADEIQRTVLHVKKQGKPHYISHEPSTLETSKEEIDDPLYTEVVRFVQTQQAVSISLLQRKFGIGYNRSARLVELLETQKIILPADGSKTRKVINE